MSTFSFSFRGLEISFTISDVLWSVIGIAVVAIVVLIAIAINGNTTLATRREQRIERVEIEKSKNEAETRAVETKAKTTVALAAISDKGETVRARMKEERIAKVESEKARALPTTKKSSGWLPWSDNTW